MNKLEKRIEVLFEKRVSLIFWTVCFLGMIFIRCFIEQFVAFSNSMLVFESVIEYTHNFFFFSITIILIWLFLSLVLQIKPQKLSGVLIFALFIVITPPLIDMIKTNGEIYWSFYLFSKPHTLWLQYVTVFGNLPSGIVYFGTKITFVSAVIISAGLIWIRKKSYLRSILGAWVIYSILFFMGSFPSFFFYLRTLLFGQEKISQLEPYKIVQFFGSTDKVLGIDFPAIQYALALAYRLDFIFYIFFVALLGILFWRMDRKKFLAILKNSRLPQLFYHGGLFFVGLFLGFLNYPDNLSLDLFSMLSVLILLISIYFSWQASVVVNDLNDFEIDKISNPERPLPQEIFAPQEYAQLGIVFFLLALLGGITLGFSFAVLLIVYQLIAWFYSASPYRLKKFPVLGTFVCSVALLMILFLGYILVSDNQTIHTLSSRVVFLMLLVGIISLPVKDFKDIAGDKKCEIWTIPVLLGEKKARLVVAMNIFLSFMLSVFFLNELRLFWWAIFFGAVAFLTVVSPKTKPRQLFWRVLAVVFVYSLVLVKIVFVI